MSKVMECRKQGCRVSLEKVTYEMIKNGTWKYEKCEVGSEKGIFWQAFNCGVAGYSDGEFYLENVKRRAEIKEKLEFILGLNINLDDFYSQIEDSKFSFLIDEFYGLVSPAAPNPYQALVETIAQQQVSFEFAMKTINNLVKLCGKRVEKQLMCFPDIQDVLKMGDEIKKARLGYRAEYILSLSKEVLNGELDFSKVKKMKEEEAIKYLTSFKGIGKWSAELFLTYAFRKNTYPAGDLGIRRGIAEIFGLRAKEVKEKDVREYIEPYGKWKSLLAFYVICYDRKVQKQKVKAKVSEKPKKSKLKSKPRSKLKQSKEETK